MRKRMLGALVAAAVVVAGGCGSSDGYHNAARPPAPVNVSVSLTAERVRISPDRLGAGPVVLLVSNQSDTSRDLTLVAGGDGGACVPADTSSGPINPQGVARIPLDLVEGVCEVGVAGGRLRPALLTVGPERKSAQDELLQP